ncbi:aspartate carbamoyltransferase [Streptomyces sp. NPDC051773]|uniref:aspartate carbamoyltransferase n=1 Tax=Streptomyces sp. NPDC051773 TaxID=3156682 RepID=UPI00343D6AF0
MNHRKRRLLTAGITAAGVGAALGAALLSVSTQREDDNGQTSRQETVAERGRTVMPFDLEETTHHFTPTKTGGVQDVVADQPDDATQVDLIRAHLRQEARAFSQGDFGDPAQIHGDSMPGLTELEDGYKRIEVRYRERADGATLTYTTEEPVLVDALHDWFEAQLSDHGGHAESGH